MSRVDVVLIPKEFPRFAASVRLTPDARQHRAILIGMDMNYPSHASRGQK